MSDKHSHRDRLAGVKNYFGDPEKTKEHNEKMRKRLSEPARPLFDRVCVKCGAPLHFAKTHEGKTIPLDLRPHIYCIVYDRTAPGTPSTVVRTDLCYVSHFFTCPFASDFSGKNREKPEDGE